MNEAPKHRTRAGQAFVEALQGNGAAEAAWAQVQTQLHVLGQAMHRTIAWGKAGEDVVAESVESLLQSYRELGAALGDALGGDFQALRTLATAHPELRTAIDELERSLRQLREPEDRRLDFVAEQLQLAVTCARDEIQLRPAFMDDPAFWSPIKPLGEQIRDIVREELRKHLHRPQTKTRVGDVVTQLKRYRAAGGPYLDQRTFAQFCNCSTTTLNKAVKQDATLRQWKDAALRSRRQKAAPRRDPGDFRIVTEQVAASEAAEPVTEEDRDRVLELLRQHASVNPSWEEEFRNMSSDQHTALVRLYLSGDFEPSPLENDPPGQRRKNKYHGRV